MFVLLAAGIGLAAVGAAAAAQSAGGIWVPERVVVDSSVQDCGFTEAFLCDGIRTPVRDWEAWVSRDSTNLHWIEFGFGATVTVQTVAIHWNVTGSEPWSSKSYKLQRWEGDARKGAYTDIVAIADNPAGPLSVHVFNAVKTDRIRIWQQGGCGSVGHPGEMGVAEIEVYAEAKPATAFGGRQDQDQQRQLQAALRARTIGVFRRARHRGSCREVVTALSSLIKQGKRLLVLDRLDERSLKRCGVVVIGGQRIVPDKDGLINFVANGGGAVFLHNACGRAGGSLFPDLWTYKGMGQAKLAVRNTEHPIMQGVTNLSFTTYAQHACLKSGKAGVSLVTDADGNDVAIAGKLGDGQAIAIGAFPGLAADGSGMPLRNPSNDELRLLRNSVVWLSEGTRVRDEWRDSDAAKAWRKQAEAKKSQFTDVTEACGLTYQWYSKGVAMADVHESGRLDIFATLCGPLSDPAANHNLFYRNDGNWKFTETSKESGIGKPAGIGAVFGDVNGDGHLDLFVSWMPEMGNAGTNALFLGDGKGGFRDVTEAAGLGKTGPTAIGLMSDADHDGDLDLYLVSNGADNTLWRNRGDATFEDVTAAFGLAGIGSSNAKGYGGNLAAIMGDLDGDGFQDLACLHDGTLRLFRNKGGKGYEEVADYMGPGQPAVAGGSLGIVLGDVDNDGDLDLYVGSQNKLLRNDGRMRFTDITEKAGLASMEPGSYAPLICDYDNDGWLDLVPGVSSYYDSLICRNNGDGTFTDVSGTIGFDAYTAHGSNFGDLDGDGDLDYYCTSWGMYEFRLFRNNQDDANYLKVRVKGRKSNTAAIGAKVWVYEKPGKGSDRVLKGYRELLGGGGAMYTCPLLEQHFGLKQGKPYTVEVLFPSSGKRVTVADVAAGQTITVEEPE